MEPQTEEKLEEEPPEEVRLRPGALLGSLWWYEATKGGRRCGSELRDGSLLRVGDGGGHERGDAWTSRAPGLWRSPLRVRAWCAGINDTHMLAGLLIRAMKREPLTFGMGFLDNGP